MPLHYLCTQVAGDDPDHGDPMMGNGNAHPNGDAPNAKIGLNEDGDGRLAKPVQDANGNV